MTNKIFDLNKPFDFNILKLGTPNLINNNNYFSKITHGLSDKNLYIQLPKCITKQGIIRGSNKSQCELCYSINEKTVIEFLENLEKYCIEQIYNNKELWFYNAKNITSDDIEELMSPLIKTYKHGKNFLIKNLVKPDKLNIYDEDENKIDLDDYNINHEFLPLININGVKFSNKNLTIEINLTQMLVLYPSDEFEKQILLKVNNNNKSLEDSNKSLEDSNKSLDDSNKSLEDSNKSLEDSNKSLEDSNKSLEDSNKSLEDSNTNLEDNDKSLKDNNTNLEKKKNNNEIFNDDKTIINETTTLEKNIDELAKEEIDEYKNGIIESTDVIQEMYSKQHDNLEDMKNKKIHEINDIELNSLDLNDLNEEDPFEIKSRDEIYLEVYKKAKKKAKEIRKNAIQAFLEAKNIKTKYNLESLVDSDSSEEEEFL
jgi:exonuclease VII small subunit